MFRAVQANLAIFFAGFNLEDNGLFENLRHRPRHGLGEGTAFSDFNLVAFVAANFVVSMILLALDDVLAIQRMLNLTFNEDRNGLSILLLETVPTRVRFRD